MEEGHIQSATIVSEGGITNTNIIIRRFRSPQVQARVVYAQPVQPVYVAQPAQTAQHVRSVQSPVSTRPLQPPCRQPAAPRGKVLWSADTSVIYQEPRETVAAKSVEVIREATVVQPKVASPIGVSRETNIPPPMTTLQSAKQPNVVKKSKPLASKLHSVKVAKSTKSAKPTKAPRAPLNPLQVNLIWAGVIFGGVLLTSTILVSVLNILSHSH